MACDTSIKARKEKKVTINENTTEIIKEKKMSSTMVLRQMPEFNMSAYDAKTGNYTTVSSEDYKGKWTVICFYPADFTFVCPTEIAAMNAKYDEFQELGVEILPISHPRIWFPCSFQTLFACSRSRLRAKPAGWTLR